MNRPARVITLLAAAVLAGCNHDGGTDRTAWEHLPNPGHAAAGEPGATLTRWLTGQSMPAGIGSEYATLTIELTDSREGTRTYRVTQQGMRDDAIAGLQYELLLEAGPDGWRVTSIHRRATCRRGLSAAGRCR